MTLPSDTYFKNGVNIPLFIGQMQRNFILTDVMKTGDHRSYEQFIDSHSMANQSFDCTGEYYTMHNYDIDQYDRKFAMIDLRIHNNRLFENAAYQNDLKQRLELLHQQGFKFIVANPWESEDNIRNQVFITGEKMKYVDIPYPYHTWTGGVSWFWSYMYHMHKDKQYNFIHSHKTQDFLYLNKAPRSHRLKLYNRLKDEGVLDNSIHTFLGLKPPIRLDAKYELPGIEPEHYPRWGKDQDIYELPYNDTSCSIVSETNDNDYEIFMTEKIWKPIMAGHLFVVHGNYLYLQKLKEMGFRTFSKYFDESYDLEQDPDKRIDKLVALIKDIKNMNVKDLYLNSQDLRKHNQETFFDGEKLSVEVNKTLSEFLKFADGS